MSLVWSRALVVVCVEFVCMFIPLSVWVSYGFSSFPLNTKLTLAVSVCAWCPVLDWCPSQGVSHLKYTVYIYESFTKRAIDVVYCFEIFELWTDPLFLIWNIIHCFIDKNCAWSLSANGVWNKVMKCGLKVNMLVIGLVSMSAIQCVMWCV